MASTTLMCVAVGLIVALGRSDWTSPPNSSGRATVRVQSEYRVPQTQNAATRQERGKPSEMWWRGDQARIEFAIERQRSKELEVIFQQTVPTLRTLRADVVRKEAVLLQLLANASTSNESAVVQAVEDLEASRRSLARTFTMMHYYMYRRLTASQRAKVHAYLYPRAENSAKSRSTPR